MMMMMIVFLMMMNCDCLLDDDDDCDCLLDDEIVFLIMIVFLMLFALVFYSNLQLDFFNAILGKRRKSCLDTGHLCFFLTAKSHLLQKKYQLHNFLSKMN